jgi:Family of unknown function (DUF6011)
MHDSPDRPRCRKCRRPLTSPLSLLAGVGDSCARRVAAEAAQDAPTVPAPTPAQSAVALLAAFAGPAAQADYETVLETADTAAVAGLLAAGAALILRRTPGGPQWLEGLGLAAAQEASQ